MWALFGLAAPIRAPLEQDICADVCVIGAGIAGLTAAYWLSQAGRSVVVLESGDLADGVLGVTTAHLSSTFDNGFVALEGAIGSLASALAAESRTAAISSVAAVARGEGMECDFERVDGHLFSDRKGLGALQRERTAARRACLPRVEMVRTMGSLSVDRACVRFAKQAQFHTLKYLANLARAITRRHGRIFANTRVDAVVDGTPAAVHAGGYTVTAGSAVVTARSLLQATFENLPTVTPRITRAIGLRVGHARVERGLYWDAASPRRCARLHRMSDSNGPYDLLIVDGESAGEGAAGDDGMAHEALRAWAEEIFGVTGPTEFRWSGDGVRTLDGLALVGRDPGKSGNVFMTTGGCGGGSCQSVVAGLLVRDLVLRRGNAWAPLYAPDRASLRSPAPGTLVTRRGPPSASVRQWLAPAPAESADIPLGGGAILDRGASKVAVYRDESGELHERSALCPHLGCIVAWNDAMKTWDCACRGSRFDRFGKVLRGPARRNLGFCEVRSDSHGTRSGNEND